MVRGKRITGEVTKLPFVTANYHRVSQPLVTPTAAAK